MATAKYSYKVGNDNGNANHDVIINGEYFTQANVNRQLFSLKGYDNVSTEDALREIMDKIVATVTSPAVKPGIYLIGDIAFSSGKKPTQLHVGYQKKSDAELPIVNTLGIVSAYAAKKHYEKTKKQPANGDVINLTIEMTTALPIAEYYENHQNRETFINRFLTGPHTVVLHLGSTNVKVNVEFTKVYVTPEAASVFWALDDIDQNEELAAKLFEEFLEDYQNEVDSITGKEVANSRILHVDIGSGTTEYPLTEPAPNPAFITGKNFGTGHAVANVIDDFGRKIGLPNITRLEFDKILKGELKTQFQETALEDIKPFLAEQAYNIMEELREQISSTGYEFDYILVYGGGSILLRDFLKEEIKEEIKRTGHAKLLYVPAELAVKLNALGLNAFVNHEVFQVKTEHQFAEGAETTNA